MKDLCGQSFRPLLLLPVGVVTGIAGGILLLHTGEHIFRKIVPYLIIMAVQLMAFQDRVRARLICNTSRSEEVTLHDGWSILPILPAAVYGGYFGAGVSIIVVAALGVVIEDSLARLKSIWQAISLSINIFYVLGAGHLVCCMS